jgi:UDP-2,3-diacylglucosamine pyrophosphatase LpxH
MAAPAPTFAFDESLVILSDVHLGNDLNDHDAGDDHARRSDKVDVDLAHLLRHYASTPPAGKRWRLVIAGDFIDFIGMAILPKGHHLDTPPDEEELAHGLGNAADHGREKLRAVVVRHAVVFEALAAFVAAGHALTIVHGNHDVEFHWDGVKQELRDVLGRLAGLAGADADAFQARIDFAPWFFHVDGVAYVEHGHQYDTLCSTEHVMAPLSPLDPRRIVRSFSDVLLRFVVRPTRGVPEYGHDRMGLFDYVMLGVHLGVRGIWQLGSRFFRAVWELLRLQRASVNDAARALREEHERRMALFAARTRIGMEKLRAIMALQVPPVTQSVPKILASVLLDRLALAVAATTLILALVVLGPTHVWCWGTAAAVAGAWIVTHRYLSARRKRWFGEHLDNDEVLLERAANLSGLLPVAFVVMGHTHQPARVPLSTHGGSASTEYINVGSWHEAEPKPDDPGAYRAARTHLVIQPGPEGPVAQFLAWRDDAPSAYSKS